MIYHIFKKLKCSLTYMLTICNYILEITHAIANINNDLDQLHMRACGNGLRLSPSKSNCIVISRKKDDYESLPNILSNDSIIEYVDKQCYTPIKIRTMLVETYLLPTLMWLQWQMQIILTLQQYFTLLRFFQCHLKIYWNIECAYFYKKLSVIKNHLIWIINSVSLTQSAVV